MGGVISLADTNDELVDNLVSAGYLQTAHVEQALRCVDRGHYYLENARQNAYRDLAWKEGPLHLSAPCIYAKALECLSIERGMSFLNLGSGTGYLSTVAGFLLGAYGQNYGVEIHEQIVQYAEQKLRDFIRNSPGFETDEFCPPKFICGNCFHLDLVGNFQSFDRIYCGAAVDADHIGLLKSFMKIRGIMVLPYEDQLLILRRTGENSYERTYVLPVSFAPMIIPATGELAQNLTINIPTNQPLSLLEICRIAARRFVRRLSAEHCGDFHLRSLLLRAELKRRSTSASTTTANAAIIECHGDDPLHCSMTKTRRAKRCTFNVHRRQSSDDNSSDHEESNGFFDVVDFRATASSINILKFRDRSAEDRRKFSRLINSIIQPLAGPEQYGSEDAQGQVMESPSSSHHHNRTARTSHGPSAITTQDDGPTTSRQSVDDSSPILNKAVDLETLKGVYLPDENFLPDNNGENFEAPGGASSGGPSELVENWASEDGGGIESSGAASNGNPASTNKRYRSESGYALFNEDVGERKRANVDDGAEPDASPSATEDTTDAVGLRGDEVNDGETSATSDDVAARCTNSLQNEGDHADEDVKNDAAATSATSDGVADRGASPPNYDVINSDVTTTGNVGTNGDGRTADVASPPKRDVIDNDVTTASIKNGDGKNAAAGFARRSASPPPNYDVIESCATDADGKKVGDDEDVEEKDVVDDDGVSDAHQRHVEERRQRNDADLERFVGDFRRRLAALPLPETLRWFLSYGRV